IPRPDRIGSSTASGWPLASAGYRFGTTRTFQPGVSGPAPLDLSAQTSGGVRSSLPSANGSFCGSIGGRSSIFELNAPGRAARSPAMIARSPVSGSMRSSGKRLLHRQVGDALFEELLTLNLKAAALVERSRRDLRVEAYPLGARSSGLKFRSLQERRADAASAHVVLDCHSAEAGKIAVEDESACADHAPADDSNHVERHRIQPVAIGLQGHALLADEDAATQFERLVHLGR